MSKFAIYDKYGTQVTDAFDNKTDAWDEFRDSRADSRFGMRSADLNRYRKDGFYADYATGGLKKPAPQNANNSITVNYTRTESINKTVDFDVDLIERFLNNLYDMEYTVDYTGWGDIETTVAEDVLAALLKAIKQSD